MATSFGIVFGAVLKKLTATVIEVQWKSCGVFGEE
jgi:hypothetical protein